MLHLTESQILFIHQFADENKERAKIDFNQSGALHFSTHSVICKNDGMQMLYIDGKYEVSQYMAGKNQNELRIYTNTKSLSIALKSLLKGNKKRKSLLAY